ncbi:anti-phage ZorAB system protein ZorA [Glutamicibacter ardleyensis]|uniref:anti-phage ZorAB system protein ZorA n=1 Tax=Glutamicibacter ardleyensis TaxID=225894 RepID=UPI003FD234D0
MQSFLGLFTDPITLVILIVLVAILILDIAYVASRAKQLDSRIGQARNVLSYFEDSTRISAGRREAQESFKDISSGSVRHAWQEFDETLVESSDKKQLWNTTSAEDFFHSENLAGEILHNRVINLVPGTLTALGVLGTFLGLTIGLSGLTLGDEADINQLRGGIQQLINGASTAFITSLAGVSLSIVAGAFKSSVERRSIRKIGQLQTAIDEAFVRQAPEQSLVNIMDTSAESLQALQTLHERIGDQFQSSMQGLVHDMQSAVTSAISTALAPAMDSLVDSTSKQSSAVFEELVGKFATSFEGIGNAQAVQLNQASDSLNNSISTVVGQFGEMLETFKNQQDSNQQEANKSTENYRGQLTELLSLADTQRSESTASIEQLSKMLSDVTSSLASSSEDLITISSTFKESSQKASGDVLQMSNNLNSAAIQVSSVAEHQKQSLEQLNAHTDHLSQLQHQIRELSSHLESAVNASAESFGVLGDHQNEFLKSLKSNIQTVHESLENSVSSLTEDMRRWLNDYGQTVSNHTSERMNEWNSQSQNYASTMYEVAQQLANVLDEFPAKESAR